MELRQYIHHPEKLDRQTLYELRSLLARFPFYQSARLLYLQNLYLLHDPSFGAELRKAALYINDCRVLFTLVEGANYVIEPHNRTVNSEDETDEADRTLSLIDRFLSTLPSDAEHPMPTAVNPTTDYVSYLMQMDDTPSETIPAEEGGTTDHLINRFILSQEVGRFTLSEPEGMDEELKTEPDEDTSVLSVDEDQNNEDDNCLTETLAKIYVKQQKYSKALEIIRRLYLKNPKKNAYFADQIRFLEKLIINNKNNKE